MKKIIVIAILMMILTIVPESYATKPVHSSQEYKVIPDDAIRLRILANSDEKEDQQLKQMIRDEVNAEITSWVEEMTDMAEARRLIEARLSEIEAIVQRVLNRENKQQTAQVEYGKNVTFPVKMYGSFIYPPGEYEAVLITLGDGEGSNWWCVLFPPLCFLDFSNGTSVAEDDDITGEDQHSEEEYQEEEDREKHHEDIKEADASEEREEDDDEVEVNFFLFEWFGWT